MGTPTERHLYVTWRHPEGSIMPIGLLNQRVSGDSVSYEFVYLKLAEQQPLFEPLPGFPELHRRYESRQLFPVFANRQMPRERPDYDAFLQQLDLDVEADPFEVLARSEGQRATDRIEVFAAPTRTDADQLVTLFFARGVRHVDGASDAIALLNAGDQLELVPEPANTVNPRAMLINTATGDSVGYAPDYLLDTIHDLRHDDPTAVRVIVEHANPPSSAPHMRLLCRLTAPWPEGYQPLSGPEFQPLVGAR
ncbi:MAG: DNA-binding protein [Actinomycetota bacterium]